MLAARSFCSRIYKQNSSSVHGRWKKISSKYLFVQGGSLSLTGCLIVGLKESLYNIRWYSREKWGTQGEPNYQSITVLFCGGASVLSLFEFIKFLFWSFKTNILLSHTEAIHRASISLAYVFTNPCLYIHANRKGNRHPERNILGWHTSMWTNVYWSLCQDQENHSQVCPNEA